MREKRSDSCGEKGKTDVTPDCSDHMTFSSTDGAGVMNSDLMLAEGKLRAVLVWFHDYHVGLEHFTLSTGISSHRLIFYTSNVLLKVKETLPCIRGISQREAECILDRSLVYHKVMEDEKTHPRRLMLNLMQW